MKGERRSDQNVDALCLPPHRNQSAASPPGCQATERDLSGRKMEKVQELCLYATPHALNRAELAPVVEIAFCLCHCEY